MCLGVCMARSIARAGGRCHPGDAGAWSRGARDHAPCPAKPRPSPLHSGTPRLAPALLLAWREGSALDAPG